MEFFRKAAPVGIFVTLGFCAFGLSASADTKGPIEVISGSAESDPASVLQQAEHGDFTDILLGSGSSPGQAVHAFSLYENIQVSQGSGVAMAPGDVRFAVRRSSVVWIAEHYQDVPLPHSFGRSSLARQRAAAQLAIWSLSSGSPQKNFSEGSRGLLALRDDMLSQAKDHSNDPIDPLQHFDLGVLNVGDGETFFNGETIRLNLSAVLDDATQVPLAQQDITIFNADGTPYQSARTNDKGLAVVQVPWEVDGPLEADWSQSLPPGTFIAASDTTLVLSQAIEFTQQKSIDHSITFDDRARAAWHTASRELNGKLGLAVGVVLGLGVICSAVVIAHAGALAKVAGAGVRVLVISIVLFACYVLSAMGEASRFHPSIVDETPKGVDQTNTGIADASSSTRFSSRLQARCAVDGDPRTAWQSGRGQGNGQSLDLSFTKRVWINVVEIVPGRVTNWYDYQHSGFPCTMRISYTDGPFDLLQLKRVADSGDDNASLENARQPQLIMLKQPLHANNVRLTVTATDPNKFSYVIDEVRLGWDSGSGVTFIKPLKQSGCEG